MNNKLELTGRIIEIFEPRKGVSQRTGNAWMTQSYLLETDGMHPKNVPFEIFGEDRIRQFGLQMNEQVTIQFDIEGSEYNGKWYVKVKCYNVVRPQAAPVQAAPQQPQATQQPIFNDSATTDNSDDLPF